MNSHALVVLEFERALGVVADRAPSALGAGRVRALRPVTDHAWLTAEHTRVAAMRALVAAQPPWTPLVVPALADPIARLAFEGTVWGAADLLAGATLLSSSRRTRDALHDERRPAMARAVLAPFAERLVAAQKEEDAIYRVIADDATVKDDASGTLRKIRRELRGAEAELIRLLERIVGGLESHQRVLDSSVTLRNGRYVIPVRRDARGIVGGIVHDTSGSGATLFVEPPAAVEFGNRIRELEAAETEEVERILAEATARLRPLQPAFVDAVDALLALESLYARARFALEFACAEVELGAPELGVHLVNARHPLLVAQGVVVVPFDLSLSAAQRTLLLSGPNTGGKTVLLKAVGLIAALVQSGVPVTVAAGSRVPLYDDIFADIGDEQSIEASLSTFSAHLKNLAEILAVATPRSLVLIDELGSGTDPQEGAALGGALLEDLTARGALTLATTHLGALKELAMEVPGVVNASLQFDAERLAPTYRLTVGIPGRSYGLSIARRLGLPLGVLARAEERMPRAERDYEALLADLERRSADFAQREQDVGELRERAAERVAVLADREARLRERERGAERAGRDEARKYLLEARAEVERTVQSMKEAQAGAVDEAAREARRTVERLAGAQGERIAELERPEPAPAPAADIRAPGPVAVGDVVAVGLIGGRLGRVVSMRDDDAVVAVGGIKMTVPVTDLARTSLRQPAEVAVPIRGDIPEPEVRTEIDVRGVRAHEVEEIVMQAVDAAVRADLRALRIIHGKGTGALRERVAEMLGKDVRVSSFRIGAWNEGGAGVTVVELA